MRELAAVARGQRKELGWSQAHTAASAGVSREWLIEFEKAKATVEVGMVLRLLRVLGIGVDLEAADVGKSAGDHSGKDPLKSPQGRRKA
jgi:transcriptional regulator with XRE-family HTH domain